MIARLSMASCLLVVLTGCANERMQRVEFDQRPSMLGAGPVAGADIALPEKTLADKVLTAIALERVTGLKPDPGRLIVGN